MSAKIYCPAKTAMQSGKAKTKNWHLEFDSASPKQIDPVFGYTSSSDMKQQIRLKFATKEAAVDYAKRNEIDYRVVEPKTAKRRSMTYSENFSYTRPQPWTH